MGSEETGAIVGGCVIGGLVLLILLSIAVYLLCGKGKRRKSKEVRKVHPPTPGGTASHSSMQNGVLPKVTSSGLWMDKPGIYTTSPSPAYYVDHNNRDMNHKRDAPLHLQRATSEMRIPHPMPGPQRIYHSQQLQPNYYNLPPMGVESLDVYHSNSKSSLNGGPMRSKVSESKHSPYYYNDNVKLTNRVERSQSDVHRFVHSSSSSRQPAKHDTGSSQGNQSQTSSKDRSNSQKSLISNDKQTGVKGRQVEEVNGSYINKGFSPEAGISRNSSTKDHAPSSVIALPKGPLGMVSTYVSKNDINEGSATDSIKLLAKNKTDDQKTFSPFSLKDAPKDDFPDLTEVENDLDFQRYNYQGSVYTKPTKSALIIEDNESSGNPTLKRMNDMVLEKLRPNNPLPPNATTHVTTTTSYENGIYQEIKTVTKTTKSEVIETVVEDEIDTKEINVFKDIVDNLVLPDISDVVDKNTGSKPSKPPGIPHSVHHHALSSVKEEVATPSSLSITNDSDVVNHVAEGVDHDALVDDVTTAGKITDTAFEFLDNYLSEDDGGESVVDHGPYSSHVSHVEGMVN
ncbi:uncharacterized protein LOC131937761 isoform X2 [Physella acuta]|uniref:uncharacterized protein LOC131937761 isoform X2 n=1 Tax=Physella acuta TaxID=109671 RepID=UPI0027DE6EC7|nr:uncharacterized protein LOC131937761 isoform X2 [Physella acuta]